MNKLSCARCGQRYFGIWSPALRCDFCKAPLEETGWTNHGRRADVMALPVQVPGAGAEAGSLAAPSGFAAPAAPR
jgi:hypothetical protein